VGSLDCMQTRWKNCPIAWQQSFKGRSKGMSTIVLVAAADYNLWFCHAACGFSGALNDGNILALSPLLDWMTDGTFSRLVEEAMVVPFFIQGEPFRRMFFLLVDGIYPRYTRFFVKVVREPITDQERGSLAGRRVQGRTLRELLECYRDGSKQWPTQSTNLTKIVSMPWSPPVLCYTTWAYLRE
jgi:hypothetical protein